MPAERKGTTKVSAQEQKNHAHGRHLAKRTGMLLRPKRSHTGTFPSNQHLARVLFDSGADKSFVSISLASMLNIPPITLDTTYDIEMANGNLVVSMSSLVWIGLSKYNARIICDGGKASTSHLDV
ncbi:putative reverse transcriptase domain-containing protein [Tanacetum coccineum]